MSMNFLKYERDIVIKAKFYIIPNMDWQDIAQELRIILWQKLDRFQGWNNASEKTFAAKIMKNKILDLARYANRKKRIADSKHLSLNELTEKTEGEEGRFQLKDPNWQRVFIQNLQEPNHPIFAE